MSDLRAIRVSEFPIIFSKRSFPVGDCNL